MKLRFFIYGILGWTIEIIWTGLGSLLKGDPSLQGFSYLWMFPIYGSAIFLETIHNKIRSLPWYIRGTIWTTVIFTIEFITGSFIKAVVGVIPWDYTGSTPYAIMGAIRLDYAPVWFIVGLIFEQVHNFLEHRLLIK